MKRKCMFYFKKALTMALVSALCVSVISGCSFKKEDSEENAASSVESTLTEALFPETNEENNEKSEENSEGQITIINHNIHCVSEGDVICTGKYPEFYFTDEFSAKFPKLRDTLERYNASWKEETEGTVKAYGHFKLIDNYATDGAYTVEKTVNIVRADDRLFTFAVSNYEFSGGAHPFHSTEYYNFDPVTGNTVPLTDVITAKPGAETSQMFWQRLYDTYPECEEEFKSYDIGFDYETNEEIDTFEQKLIEDRFNWAVLPDGLWIYFSPYDVASYATGYLEMNFPDSEYPGLVLDAFKIAEKFDADRYVKYEEDPEITEVGPEEPVYEGSATIANPCWEGFTNYSYSKENPQYVTLEKTKEDKTDWIDISVWCDDNNIPRKEFPYEDGTYRYVPDASVEYDYMYTGLEIYDAASSEKLYDFDLYTLANGPDEESDKYSAETQYIRWARLVDDMLYVELSMNGYASEEPDSSYIVGINVESGQLAFRSEPQTANAETFEVIDDCIICGYGFTAEPDYLYILDRYTGERIETIPVNSAPEFIKAVDDTLYVACYNTGYEFKIKEK
ncbi:DUF3298 and DUF4163 domain-containing protein [Butyrivibrio sp. FCS014]|uniref:DUF3298 and DUF4163 domain-containing protein n=1 Tax=Butyrivibrio sp. FCS014 TaxID=1408304 RepID=UPI00046543A9|nr:DUF3298 and DUF4163 domain-containing protein [Butyrivibrio sp. FCS014]